MPHLCANCGGELDRGQTHEGSGGYACPSRMTEDLGRPEKVFEAAVEVLAPCNEDQEEEARFQAFWLKHGNAIMDATVDHLFKVQSVARAIWSASLQARR